MPEPTDLCLSHGVAEALQVGAVTSFQLADFMIVQDGIQELSSAKCVKPGSQFSDIGIDSIQSGIEVLT